MTKKTSQQSFVISAVCTMLENDESLCVEGMKAHLEDQWRAGIQGLLVAGSMGLMQLLTDRAYRQLIEHSVRISAGRGEIMVGVGDAGFMRTKERIELVNRYDVDGVVVLTPYLFKFKPEELVDYYRGLADVSRHPLYLYDLPGLTGVKLDFETVERVADHPNIHGIKASCDPDWTRELLRRIGDRFRVIIAQPAIMDSLLREGVHEHLDGIFSVAPAWTMELVRAADAGDWDLAAEHQRRMNRLLDLVRQRGVQPCVTAILNARGIPGRYGTAPFRQFDAAASDAVLAEPIVRELLGNCAGPPIPGSLQVGPES